MNGKKTLNKELSRMNRRAVKSKSASSSIGVEPLSENGVDVGDWRITQDEDGALIIYNFITGSKILLARP